MNQFIKKALALGVSFGLLAISFARAEVEIIPESRHKLYQSYGLFNDEQTTALWRGSARLWGSLGVDVPLVGIPDSPMHPQIVVITSLSASMRVGSAIRIYSETFDLHVGGAYEFELNPSLRFSLGYYHYSGHVADGVLDLNLIDTTVGYNLMRLRTVYDYGRSFRVGGSFKPYLNSVPSMHFFAFEEFAEWYPLGIDQNPRHGAPFLAAGIEEYGSDRLRPTYHLQVGVDFGHHFEPFTNKGTRAVIGYYNGTDPRLKYQAFVNDTVSFGYLGFMANL